MKPEPGTGPRRAPLFAEHGRLRRVAMCPPRHYQLDQPINVIQAEQRATGRPVARERALAEHAELVSALRSRGIEVVMVEADPRFPYQINTRDAGLGTPAGLILGRFRLPIRQGEEDRARAAAAAAGATVLGAVQAAAFEGGDLVALGPRRAAVGLGPRTEPAAIAELEGLLGPDVELVGVPFAERFLHLDMVFNVVADKLALACAAALPPAFLDRVRADGFRLLPVSEPEVFTHGCNVLAIGESRVVSHPASARVNELLRAEGLELVVVDVGELARSGGGPRCLTLPLERACY